MRTHTCKCFVGKRVTIYNWNFTSWLVLVRKRVRLIHFRVFKAWWYFLKCFTYCTSITFKMVWFLYELNSSLFKRRLLGISQSMALSKSQIKLIGYFSLKSSGIVSLTSFLVGHMLIWPSLLWWLRLYKFTVQKFLNNLVSGLLKGLWEQRF